MDMKRSSGIPIYPDANSTLRLSYGRVLPYTPADGVVHKYYTTLSGVMQKEDPNNWEFVVPAKLKQLYQAKDFGRYAMTSQLYPKYRFIRLDLTDKTDIKELFQNEKFDIVINLAAQAGVRYSLENPYAYVKSNILGFLNILENCRYNGIKHLLYASSSSVYGMNSHIPYMETDFTDTPISIYAATKKTDELMAYSYSKLYGVPTTGLRFFTVYGPWGRPDMAPFLFLKSILEGTPIKVFNHET